MLDVERKHYTRGSRLEAVHRVRSKFKEFPQCKSASAKWRPVTKIYFVCVKCNVQAFEKERPRRAPVAPPLGILSVAVSPETATDDMPRLTILVVI